MGSRALHQVARNGPALAFFMAADAMSHADGPPAPSELWSAWNLEPWLLALFALFTILYLRGLATLWRRAGIDRGATRLQLGSHLTGILLLLIALISPLDALGEALSAAHMAQHMLLFFAAPFLILSAPLPVYLWALPLSWRRSLANTSRQGWFAGIWGGLSAPLVAWCLYALALWSWHAPSLYQAALSVPFIHDLEHFSFLASALLFWWAVLRRASRPAALILLFTTMLHSGLLAALMTFSTAPWYPAYGQSTLPWGLTPLQDQQVAGLVMWISGGIGYLSASLGFLALWLQELERRSLRAEAAVFKTSRLQKENN